MSNKTLGKYNSGHDTIGLTNHIYFNRNFIALNTGTRILETLRHEMIHQYQDEVMYEKTDNEGKLIHGGQKRPKDWHNGDFRDFAKKVDIPAIGKHCTGSPANMPEAKSYNRKFRCGCMASNGHPLTIWSTREVDAVCNVCGEPFEEVKKSGGTIAVVLSDIEKGGQDAVEAKMQKEFKSFEKFQDKYELTEALEEVKSAGEAYKEGIYQKGHLSYTAGFRYWLAWGSIESKDKAAEEIPKKKTDSSSKPSKPLVSKSKAKLTVVKGAGN
jgi:predicted SprT family Zn-dependent metalloprotease